MTATVDLSDNTLAFFTQTPRKTVPSQEFEEGARKHTRTQVHNKNKIQKNSLRTNSNSGTQEQQ